LEAALTHLLEQRRQQDPAIRLRVINFAVFKHGFLLATFAVFNDHIHVVRAKSRQLVADWSLFLAVNEVVSPCL